jgi:hypothetical protein
MPGTAQTLAIAIAIAAAVAIVVAAVILRQLLVRRRRQGRTPAEPADAAATHQVGS